MKLNFLTVLVFAGCLVDNSSGMSVPLSEVLVINIAKDIVVVIDKAWKFVDLHSDFSSVPIQIRDKTESKLFGKLGIVTAKLDQLAEQQTDTTGNVTISSIFNSIPAPILWELRLNDLSDYLTRIDIIYRRFQNYEKNQEHFERLALEDLAKHILSNDSSSVNNLVESMYALFVPNREITDGGLLHLLDKSLTNIEGDMFCNSRQSSQQLMYHLYNAIALTELKAYTMVQFSYMFLRLYNQGHFATEFQIMRTRFEERTNAAIRIVKSAMKTSGRELWNCDPKQHIKDETYIEITRLLQGYVENEEDLNSEGTCWGNCDEYTYTESYSRQRKCTGKIINCRFVDSDLWICPAAPLSSRRYEYIVGENGRVLGRKASCRRAVTKVESWHRRIFWQCSYCFCLCDQQGSTSDRYFNMRSMIADTDNNRVITGLRFVKHNRIIHLQIQEGKLLPRGNIDINTVHWVPVEDYKITDRKIYNGQDYHTLAWGKCTIDLDTLEADDGHILTGVRFKEIGTHLNFEIYVTKFDFETGKLINPIGTSKWIDNTDTYASVKRTKVYWIKPDVPTRSTKASIPASKTGQYIDFTHTDMDRDAAQTTIPFLDAQNVDSLQPVPLSGAGIFYKRRQFFGGFIAPTVITYDFSRHLQIAFPEE